MTDYIDSEGDRSQPRVGFMRRRMVIMVSAGVVAVLVVGYFVLLAGLPDAEEIRSYRPESTASPDAIDWSLPAEPPIRIWVPLDKISPLLQKAVVISEDDLFHQHNGVNYDLMIEAFKVNWKKKRYVRGASTITMQLARNAFLHKRKTIVRKVREIIVARRIETKLSKSQILELYLNIIEWGENLYGAEAASRYYFGTSAADLDLAQASLLAAIIPNPKYFNPFKRLASSKRMQKRVLWLMQISRAISEAQAQSALASTIRLRSDLPLEELAPVDSLEESKYRLTNRIEPAVIDLAGALISENETGLDTLAAKDSTETKIPTDSLRTPNVFK